MSSAPFLGPIWFRDIVDISTGKPAQNTINTVPVSKSQLEYTKPRNHAIRPKLPSNFDAAAYLRANPDVAAAKTDPAEHWINFGYHEGRPMR
jgi:hypothetical protein